MGCAHSQPAAKDDVNQRKEGAGAQLAQVTPSFCTRLHCNTELPDVLEASLADHPAECDQRQRPGLLWPSGCKGACAAQGLTYV